MNTPTVYKCSQCGSDLIEVSTSTEKPEGSLFPQTTTLYRCSNQECQDEKDKQATKRQQVLKERADADKKRTEGKIQEKTRREYAKKLA